VILSESGNGEWECFWERWIIKLREGILEKEHGPVLGHGLKGLRKSTLALPSAKSHYPSGEALEWRYGRFTRVGGTAQYKFNNFHG